MNDATMPPSLEVLLSSPEMPKGEREYVAFLRLLPQLLSTHEGRFVAVHNEQVVDSDTDDIALIRRVHARFGYVPIHVGRVEHPLPIMRIPHYREYRPRGKP